MDERLLHYIWQFQQFDHRDLTTTDGSPLSIFHPGHYNLDGGPDFHDGKIQMKHIDLGWQNRNTYQFFRLVKT